jgi:hypothetical protein
MLLSLAVYYCLAVTATCDVVFFFSSDNAVSQRNTIRCMQQRSALLLLYCCFTDALLLLLYCCFTAAQYHSLHAAALPSQKKAVKQQ